MQMSGTIYYLKLVINNNFRGIIRIINEKMTVMALLFFACFCLTGCSSESQISEQVNTENEKEKMGSGFFLSDSLLQEDIIVPDKTFNEAYADILEEIIDTNTFFDGTILRYSSDDNIRISFAVWDVDEDGIEELIINWSNFSANGYMEWVYEYSPDRNEYVEELATFNAVEFYESGLATALLSHNGSGGPLWPYRLLQYDTSVNEYKENWLVQSWSKQNYSEEDYSNIDTDLNNVGVFYEVDYAGDKKAEMISQSEFDELCQRTFSEAKKLEVLFFEYTEENIQRLREGKLEPALDNKLAKPQKVSIDSRNINSGERLSDGTYSFQLLFVSKLKNTAENVYSVVGNIKQREMYGINDIESLNVNDAIEYDGRVVFIGNIEKKDSRVIVNGGTETEAIELTFSVEDNAYIADNVKQDYRVDYVLLYASEECVVVDKFVPEFSEVGSFKISSFDEYFKDKENSFDSFAIQVEDGKVVKLIKSK